jgi:hypothetical protein
VTAGRCVVLVEGPSDVAALTALARRLGRPSDGITVVDIGGATNIARAVTEWTATGSAVVGLCDAAEAHLYRRAFDGKGRFFVCTADLEDELINALGPEAVERVIDAAGELDTFRIFQRQPAQRQRPIEAQLRRFIGTKSGRKIRYGTLLTEALDLDRLPEPLAAVLSAVAR